MVILIVVAVVVVVAALAAGVALVRRSRSNSAPAEAPASVLAQHPDPGPMTGLEEALNAVTDTAGHTIAERLDDETPSVDQLRVPDDTGPLLRRALDSIETSDDESGAGGATDVPSDD